MYEIYIVTDNNDIMILSFSREETTPPTILPLGPYRENYTVTALVNVYDSYNTPATVFMDINVGHIIYYTILYDNFLILFQMK